MDLLKEIQEKKHRLFPAGRGAGRGGSPLLALEKRPLTASGFFWRAFPVTGT